MSDPTIHLPMVGDVKRNYVIIGGIVLLLIGVYAYRQHQANAASAADTASTTTDTSADIDPATGYATGSAEDLAALQAQSTASGFVDAASGGGGGGGESGGGISTPPATGYASNGAWAQAAETYLVSNAGADPSTVAAALGKYVTGQAVTEAQQSIAEQAIAFAGYPPIADADGYPPSIRQVPPVVAPVPAVKTPANVHAISSTKSSVTVAWNGQANARYYMYVNGHKSVILYGTEWDVNSAHAGITIKSGTAYSINVTAVDQSGKESAKSPTLTVHTAK